MPFLLSPASYTARADSLETALPKGVNKGARGVRGETGVQSRGGTTSVPVHEADELIKMLGMG